MNAYRKALKQRIACLRSVNDGLRENIQEIRNQVPGCCQPPACLPPIQYLYDEWVWSEGVDTQGGLGVARWTGKRNGKVLETVAGRIDDRRARVEDGAILSNGADGIKTAYQAALDLSWYSGDQPALGNCLFWVVEIDLFLAGQTILWNHLISGANNNNYNSFSSQTSTQLIGTRTNGIFQSISKPSWIQPGIQRYIVEMRYGDSTSLIENDFRILLNGYLLKQTPSIDALKNIIGMGVVAPLDYSANSSLNRRLLSILALKRTERLTPESILEAREYLSCLWEVLLQP